MNSKLLALEAKKRLQVERERDRVSTRKQQTGRKRERDSARELRRERERERERRTNEVSRSQIGRSDVASLASRISCSLCHLLKHWSLTFD
jgi:hypothetical protein